MSDDDSYGDIPVQYSDDEIHKAAEELEIQTDLTLEDAEDRLLNLITRAVPLDKAKTVIRKDENRS